MSAEFRLMLVGRRPERGGYVASQSERREGLKNRMWLPFFNIEMKNVFHTYKKSLMGRPYVWCKKCVWGRNLGAKFKDKAKYVGFTQWAKGFTHGVRECHVTSIVKLRHMSCHITCVVTSDVDWTLNSTGLDPYFEINFYWLP